MTALGLAALRTPIGVTGQFSAVDNLLTGRENLLLMAELCHLDRRGGGLRARNCSEPTGAAGKPAAAFSSGMRRRRLGMSSGYISHA